MENSCIIKSANSESANCTLLVSFSGWWVEIVKKNSLARSSNNLWWVKFSLDGVLTCCKEMCISVIGFNYHILRMDNISCQCPKGRNSNWEQWKDNFPLLFLYTYRVPIAHLNQLSPVSCQYTDVAPFVAYFLQQSPCTTGNVSSTLVSLLEIKFLKFWSFSSNTKRCKGLTNKIYIPKQQ